jgi:hypothetical protein
LDEETGKEEWRYRAGSRVETSPSLYAGGCFFGSNDGYVYALRTDDGSMMWRTRLAPREKRIMEHGIPESSWPVYGSVLVYKNTLYASAGRNSESDGGVVIVALDPQSGLRKWSRHIDVVQFCKDDLLSVVDGEIAWHRVRLDPQTGEGDLVAARAVLTAKHEKRGGMWDNSYVYNPTSRRVGKVYSVDGKNGFLMAWNEKYIVDEYGQVVPRIPEGYQINEYGSERKRLFFDVAKQPTAMAACANAVVLGYSSPFGKTGKIAVRTYDPSATVEVPVGAGVVHNGIAVTRNGLVASLENGTVAFLAKTPIESGQSGFVFRVNCGGNEYTDKQGNVWQADQEYEAGSWGRVGGGGYDRTPDYTRLGQNGQRRHMASPDPYLYLTELSAQDAYRFTVPNGRYKVVMHFAEGYFAEDMVFPNGDLSWVRRRFSVSLNGEKILRDFDVVAEGNGRSHTPVIKEYETEVVNGDITIGFAGLENNPMISAIEVIGI